METKRCIRKQILAVRNQLTEAERLEKSRKIEEKLYSMNEYREADCILGFVGYGGEVETIPFLERAVSDGKKVYCPVSNADSTMEFYRFTSKADLITGYKNIPEPSRQAEKFEVKCERTVENYSKYAEAAKCVTKEEHVEKHFEQNVRKAKVFMLMPGVAFDRKRHRIGYGKGFYDRFLTTYEPDYIVAVCFVCQIVEEFSVEDHDFLPQRVVTETKDF